MDVIVIRGGTVLDGEITVSGSKNAALPLLFSTLLTAERCVLRNVPVLRDIRTSVAVLKRLGARLRIAEGYVEAEAGRLRGAKIVLDFPSVGATQQLMMAAALAEGTTVLENAAREPENVCLARVLARMGAGVRGAGTSEVTIEGRPELGGGQHT